MQPPACISVPPGSCAASRSTNLAGNPETPGHLLLPFVLEITCSLVEAFLCKAVCGTSARSPRTRIFRVTEPFGGKDYQWLPGWGCHKVDVPSTSKTEMVSCLQKPHDIHQNRNEFTGCCWRSQNPRCLSNLGNGK